MPINVGKQTNLWHTSAAAKLVTTSYVAGSSFKAGDKDKLWLTVALSGTAATTIHLDVQFSADNSNWYSLPNLPSSGELDGSTATHVVPVSIVGRHFLRVRVKRTGGDATTAALVKGSNERSYGDLTGATVDSTGQISTKPNGNVASDAADSGNPVKIGAVYEASLTTVDDGDRTDLKADASGRMLAVASGAVASDAADAGNPVKVGGVYNATPAAVDDGDIVDIACDIAGRVLSTPTGDAADDAADAGNPVKVGGVYEAVLNTVDDGDRVNFKADASGRQLVVSSGDVASDAADAGNPLKVGGVYNATLPTVDDGDRADIQTDVSGRLIVNSDPVSVAATIADVTNAAQNTTFYYYVDMEGYRSLSISTANISTAPTDTTTVTVEATCQDDGTAQASCDYVDITQYGTTCLTAAAAASFADTNVAFNVPDAGCFKYVRVKVVTNAGGGNDSDHTIYTIKHR